MSETGLVQIIEGALLAAGRPLTVPQLAELFEEHERPANPEIREALKEIGGRCEDRGFELQEVASGFRFQVRQVNPGTDWQDVDGNILVFARLYPDIRYGDSLVLRGRLEEPPDDLEGFDYRDYLARRGIHALMSWPGVTLVEEDQGSPALSLVYRLRSSLARSLAASLPEPQASLAQTLLLGIRGGVPAEVTQAFRDTGTSHLLAISGLHVGVVLGLFLPLGVALLA